MRTEDMLNAIIENLLVGESPRTVIRYLLYLGFSEDDIASLHFEKESIREVEEDMDYYDCVCPVFA